MTLSKQKPVDKFLLITVLILAGAGMAMFISASLGVLAKNQKIFYPVLFSQLVLGLGLGLIGMYVTSRLDYKLWRKFSLYIFIGSVLLTTLVFVPALGLSHGGAERWISLGFVSFQPAEILKFSFVIYFATWLSGVKNKVKDFKYGLLPLFIILSIIALVLLNQPDTKSFILISLTGIAMLFVSDVPLRQIFGLGLILGIFFATLVFFTPYLQERVKTFIDPAHDARGDSYQIQQSLIAIGSGGVVGRGYGQSIQKFSYLPEAQGDSIFAVLGEELGFIGGTLTILLYCIFAMRGIKIANQAPDLFSRLLTFGIVILVTAQSFMHIASVIGVFPLTGVPLPFMSHGGTSLMVYLFAIGIVLQVSRFAKKST